jgi:hypothetical protein
MLGQLRVAAAAGREGVGAEVAGCKLWAFSKHTGLEGLRKWLGERSLAELQQMVADDGQEGRKGWAGADSRTDPLHVSGNRDALCSHLAAVFVRTELREDLRAALERGASDAQVEALLLGWGAEPRSGARADRMEQAAAALDSEERWGEVEGWVRLFFERIQGRTRLGLKALMAREKGKVGRFGLTEAEVLAVHLYTGPEFVPLNGICRSFPTGILDLLAGNTMCTTLFCISSALKKLSQTTELPANR